MCVSGCAGVCVCLSVLRINFRLVPEAHTGNGALIELNRQKTRAERVCQVDSQFGAH